MAIGLGSTQLLGADRQWYIVGRWQEYDLEWLRRRHLLTGQLIKLYIIAYLVYRFFTEYIRPEPILWNGLTGYQLAAAALVPVFANLWLQDSRQLRETKQRSQDPEFQPASGRKKDYAR